MSARLAHIATALLLVLAATASAAPSAGKGGRKDSAPPSIAISAPTAGATLAGSVYVSGSAADNVQVASVQVSVDGGAYRPAAGATSWSFALDSGAYSDGAHTFTAKATDSSGKTATTSESVTFANAPVAPPPPPPPPAADTTPPSVAVLGPVPGATVGGTVTITGSASDNSALAKVELKVDSGAYQLAQGTNAWTFAFATTAYADGAHTLTARATDGAGNAATSSISVNLSNAAPPPTPGQMVTPEGATIEVASDVTGWTPQQVYDLLKPNAYQLSLLGRSLTVKLQTTSPSATSASAVKLNGVYSSYKATIYLQAKDGTTFTSRPDAIMAHEYGHAWTLYHLYISHQGDWTPYLTARGLVGDPRLESSYVWSRSEMVADDYRLLFGTAAAQDELSYLNPDVPDPRSVGGLNDFFVNVWGS